MLVSSAQIPVGTISNTEEYQVPRRAYPAMLRSLETSSLSNSGFWPVNKILGSHVSNPERPIQLRPLALKAGTKKRVRSREDLKTSLQLSNDFSQNTNGGRIK